MKNDQTKTTGSRTDPLPGICFVIVIWSFVIHSGIRVSELSAVKKYHRRLAGETRDPGFSKR